jgi:hypothetical protein
MTLFAQLVATAFQVVQDRLRPPERPDSTVLSRYVREAQQLRFALADTKHDLEQLLATKFTKPQILDRLEAMRVRLDLVLEATQQTRENVQ